MSASVEPTLANPNINRSNEALLGQGQPARSASSNNTYKGFVAGIFSGIAKLAVGHPFDTIKVRLQTTQKSQFKGPLDCLLQTVQKEGVRGLYKGATPPLVGWMFMDSVMLGSLNIYRRLLHENVFTTPSSSTTTTPPKPLPTIGHALSGLLSGLTVSLISTPIEHIKARLQTQYHPLSSSPISSLKSSPSTPPPFYRTPLHTLTLIHTHHGLPGLYTGLTATLLFRSFFIIWWGSYDLLSNLLTTHTTLPPPAINFWAGGLSAQLFWITSYPCDVVKQRIMTDPLGGTLGDGVPQFRNWREAARAVGGGREGWRGYWRGFVPCLLRAFPANAVALVVFEGVMGALPG